MTSLRQIINQRNLYRKFKIRGHFLLFTRYRHRLRRFMAPPSDPSSREADAAVRRQNKGPPYKFLVPLVYAPVLPLIRISLRRSPVLRDRLFIGVLVGAFAHGAYLVSDLYDSESK